MTVATPDRDRRMVEAWIEKNSASAARLVVDGEQGGLILHVPDAREMARAREDLGPLLQQPQRLRVRRWRPSPDEIDRVTDVVWARNPPLGAHPRVTATGLDPSSGLLRITLSRVDHEYAANLENITEGLAFVDPIPQNPVAL